MTNAGTMMTNDMYRRCRASVVIVTARRRHHCTSSSSRHVVVITTRRRHHDTSSSSRHVVVMTHGKCRCPQLTNYLFHPTHPIHYIINNMLIPTIFSSLQKKRDVFHIIYRLTPSVLYTPVRLFTKNIIAFLP